MNIGNQTSGQPETDATSPVQVGGDDTGRPKVKAISAREAMRSAAGEQGDSSSADAFGGALSRLSQRLEALEISMKMTAQADGTAAEASAAVKELRQGVQFLSRQVQTLADRIEQIAANLEATPAYGLRKKFVCSTCKNRGFVAAPAKCTVCGHEIMVGWPSQRKDKA